MDRRWVVAVGLTALLAASGCAYSLVEGDHLRDEPFESVVARTARARGIEPQGRVDVRVIEPAGIAEVVRRVITRSWSADQIDRYERGYAAMGVWPRDRDMLSEYIEVMGEEVGGLYDPGDRRIYLVDTGPGGVGERLVSSLLQRDLGTEAVLTHELVHLLQHQAYPELLEDDPFYYDQDDAAAAVQAAVEGDATRYGFEGMELGVSLPSPEALRRDVDASLDDSANGALARAPALIRLTLGFPYTHGYALAYREGPELLEAPPASTEQVLHASERRADFAVLDLSPLWAEAPAGCSAVRENTLGELGVSVLLQNLAGATDPAAWEGWDGDRFLVFDCAGRPALLWLSFWDSQSDALEFAAAYAAVGPALAASAGLPQPPRVERSGRRVLVYSRGLAGLAASADGLPVHRVATLAGLRNAYGADAPAR
jgi:hypothetical protein